MPAHSVIVANLPAGLREGDVIAGRYRLEQVIGSGGMGVVVAAHHLELDERVAVKFLSAGALSDPEAVGRFDREVRAAARLRNEHIARVYDAGKLPDGARYMVLEYLDGEDLAARVRRTGPLSAELAVRYLLQACSAVIEAHGKGIIHRDIKPANIFVIVRADGAEVIKILDFGVMKRMNGTQPNAEPQQTEPGTIVGTPFYTSPEQLRGSSSLDGRTDIWSLGATLFELLAGVPPFSGKTYAQIIANVLEAEPLPLRSLCPSLPEGLATVVMRCLEKKPANRYESVAEFAVALADTVELDSEQRGLLERIVRHGLVSSPFASPSALITPLSTRRDASSASGAGTKGYDTTTTRPSLQRLLLLGSAAILTAAAVVWVGLPWLPQFGAQTVAPKAKTLAPVAQQAVTEQETTNPVPEPTETTEPIPAASSATAAPKPPKNLPLHGPAKTKRKPTEPSVSATPSAEPTEISAAQKKNPLLVRPR